MVSAMKRSFSDDSDHEDVFDDRLKSGSPTQSCQIGMSDRKKRRGIIEKRRRDRINNSLSELRRLVPTAFEKQGSAKLEKAEILQMTVDHLKVLHQKGLNSYNYPDPHTLAMDYRSVGFRECAAEVARYLVAVEGMDIQDPLRLRLMSHLQCFSAQRDLAAKANMQNNSWNNTQYNSNTSSMISPPQHNQDPQLTSSMTSHSALPTVPSISYSDSRFSQHSSDMSSNFSHMRLPPTGSVAPSISNSCTPVTHAQVTSSLVPTLPQVQTHFPMSLNMNSIPMLSPNTHNGYSPTNTAVKPYRPWGAELAY